MSHTYPYETPAGRHERDVVDNRDGQQEPAAATDTQSPSAVPSCGAGAPPGASGVRPLVRWISGSSPLCCPGCPAVGEISGVSGWIFSSKKPLRSEMSLITFCPAPPFGSLWSFVSF